MVVLALKGLFWNLSGTGNTSSQRHCCTPSYLRVLCTYVHSYVSAVSVRLLWLRRPAGIHVAFTAVARRPIELALWESKKIHNIVNHACVRACVRASSRNKQVKLTEGEYTNLKLTTPEDLVIAGQILEARRINDYEYGVRDDDDDEDGKESISMIRANEKWTDEPRPVGDYVEEEKESISLLRADEQWTDSPAGVSGKSYDEPMVNLSKLRANS